MYYNVSFSFLQRGNLGLVTRVRADEKPPLYWLSHLSGSPIGGSFYAAELRHLSKYDSRAKFEVSKVHREKEKNGQMWARVSYSEIPNRKFWVLKKDLEGSDSESD